MKIAVFYYTQSGQALEIAQKLTKPMEHLKSCAIVYKEIKPLHEFHYPWSRCEFFDAFPESRLGLPPSGIEKIDLSDIDDSSIVIIVGQSWFLSPSLPLQSFLEDPEVRFFMRGRKVVFVNGCRNMWLITMHKVKKSLNNMGAELVGHIVMQDQKPNLVSVLTIIRWLFYGKKEKAWMLPRAGVSPEDMAKAKDFGKIIVAAATANDYTQLQEKLLHAGAINYKPSVLFLERAGHRMFGFWARFIRKKGEFGDKHRQFRRTLFTIYLVVVLYLISPFGVLFFWLTCPFRNISREKEIDCLKFGVK